MMIIKFLYLNIYTNIQYFFQFFVKINKSYSFNFSTDDSSKIQMVIENEMKNKSLK